MWRLTVLAFIATASAQIPSLGWCPDYQPMENFNMNRYLGTWYEEERYFTVSELGSRCVTTKYESTPEGRIVVANEITNFLTGMKRVLEGHLQTIGREGEGRIIVKYNTLPVPYDTEYSILDTDYDNFAVMWSCSGIGPVHTQNAWILTRDRLANSAVMQRAYAVLDKYKISRTFFVKTNQADCTVLPNPAAEPQESKTVIGVEVVPNIPVVDVVEEKSVEQPVEKMADPESKPNVPQERAAVPVPAEEISKPMQVPELIMSEFSDKKEDKKEKKEEKKEKKDEKKEKKDEKKEKKDEKKEKPEEEKKEKPVKVEEFKEPFEKEPEPMPVQ